MSFHKKYEPQNWSDLVFADPDIALELQHYAKGQTFDHILLHGPHGSGKSATAKVLAATSYGRALNDAVLDIVEHTGEIKDSIKAWKQGSRFGYYCFANNIKHPYGIIQEVDRYDHKIQLKLRSLMDEMIDARFIFTTNAIQNVDPGIRDRCDCFELVVPKPSDWAARARSICSAEGIALATGPLTTLLQQTGGSARDYLRAIEKTVLDAKSLQRTG
jgi:replication factor C subunit 3/5